MVFRFAVLTLWLLSSVGGFVYALRHFIQGRKQWAEKRWRGDDDESAARFWRLSARALLTYFVLVNTAGLIALFWPGPDQPLRTSNVINTFILIASNFTAVWLIRLLRDYAQDLRVQKSNKETIDEVLAQLKTDSGSTVRDAVDRLEELANELAAAVAANGATADRLESLVSTLGAKADAAADAARVIAENLAVAKERVEGVASDLADSHLRADAVANGEPGEAADAASQSEGGS